MRQATLALMAALLGVISSPPAIAAATAFQLRLTELKAQAPRGFTLARAAPFIVLGDEPAAVVRERANTIVGWAVTRLKQDYFANDPTEVIAIWLFRDKASYEHHARALFNDTPTTPFGYYSPPHRALIMNIATGGGTLVHEIVHPFLRANFPGCPTWFDEGLASLFEACAERDGHICGRINWRLPGLQEAIRNRTTLPFRELTALTHREFYGPPGSSGYNRYYGQARYLCFYLQERGLLPAFYREFVAHAADDPTGYATLQRVLGEADMDSFQKKWEAFVLGLPPP